MCGIAGAIGRRSFATEAPVCAMVRALTHRGPDDHGIHSVSCGEYAIGLGNTRLSILDLSEAGHQPMLDEDTSNWIAYNGEVFNFQDLRRDLVSKGARFHSNTDTEVVLKAYALLGPSCVQHFRGMFAFAIWDAKRQELFLARDRLGLKPLYYAQLRDGMLFASEVRALLASELVQRKLDPTSLETFLANGFVVSPRTILAGVRSLLPGCWMRVRADGSITEISRYWKMASSGDLRSATQLASEAEQTLAEAVRLRMISDVPLGAFLSGGLDSSLIVSLMRRVGGDVRTFSVSFEEAAYDESRYARLVAEQLGTRHTEFRLERQAFYDTVPAALAAMDQPTFDGVNTYCVARAARNAGLKVALSGLGADELFGGYEFFNSARWVSRAERVLRLVPHQLAGAAIKRLQSQELTALAGPWKALSLLSGRRNGHRADSRLAAYQTAQSLFPAWARLALTSPDLERDGIDPVLGLPPDFVTFVEEEIQAETDMPSVLSKLALRLFLGERCLRDSDSMSMGVSLEVRAPFTDHVLLESVTRFAGKMRCAGAPDKPVLRGIAETFLGSAYPRRRKQGFLFPFQEWLPAWKQFREFADSEMRTKSLVNIGINPSTVAKLFERLRRNPTGMRWSRVWAIFVATEWCAQHRVYA